MSSEIKDETITESTQNEKTSETISESKESPTVCEILKPVDHTQNHKEEKESPSDTSPNSEQSNITHIIIPIDHTIEAQLKDLPAEPIKKPNVEIQINDKPYGKDEIVKDKKESEESKGEKPALLIMKDQSMSIDEERSYLDRKIVKETSLEEDYNKWSTIGDHEYEPINPPDDKTGEIKPGPPLVRDEVEMANIDDDASSTTSADRKFLRIPLDDEVVVPEDGQEEDAAMTDEGISLEERFLNATPTTIGSKTDGEMNTSSQVDSSALETLPLQRESRRQATLAKQESTTSQNFGERVRSSANRLRTRLRAMGTRESKVTDRPLKESKRTKPKRPKSERPSLLERARKFERPKFTVKLPDRPKISMPKMPERPKISMPKMPERPKISMPKMPERPKLKMPDISMPKMPDRSKLKMPDISMPKMPDINFPSFSRKISKEEAPVQGTAATLTTSGSELVDTNKTPKRKRFDFDFRTYPKALSRQKKTKTVVETTVTTSTTQSSEQEPKGFLTIPDWVTMPRTKRKKGPVGQRWAHKFKDIKYADESPHRSREDLPQTASSVDTDEPLIRRIPLRIPVQSSEEEEKEELNKENIERSNILYDDRRTEDIHQISAMEEDITEELKETTKPKIEEVYDEEDDIHVKSSLRSGEATSGESLQPESNVESNVEDRSYQSSERGGVIEEIDSDEFFVREKGLSQDNIDVSLYISSEIREAFQNPVNILSQMANNDVVITDYEEYDRNLEEDYTKMRDSPEPQLPPTPPLKTVRKKKKLGTIGKREDISKREEISMEEKEEKIEIESMKESDDINAAPPVRPSRSRKASEIVEKVPEEITNYQTYPPTRPSRSRKNSIISRETESKSILQDDSTDQNVSQDSKPSVPLRRRRSLRSATSLNIPQAPKESSLRKGPNISLQDIRWGYERQEAPPVPKRRSRSSQSRSTVHSVTDEDRTPRVTEEQTVTRVTPEYAKIEKPKYNVPSAQPPPRQKRKRIRETQFFTVPRRLKDEDNFVPKRPARTYSTLKQSSFEKRINREEQENKENIVQDAEYIEIDDEDISDRKLQSGEVIQKMKSRPLPAPPRPPRKTHRSNVATENILKEIHPQDVNSVTVLRSEDNIDLMKETPETVVKGTLLLGSQTNIITEIQAPTIAQEEVAVEKKDVIKLESERAVESKDMMMPASLEEIETVRDEQIEEKQLEEGTEKQDLPEKSKEEKDEKPMTGMMDEKPQRSESVQIEKEIIEVEMSTQTDPLPDDFICEEIIAEPTDIILTPTNRKTITEQIPPTEIQQTPTSEIPSSFDFSEPDIPTTRPGLLEQQSDERLFYSPQEHYDETGLEDNMIRLARSQQSSLIGRPVTETEERSPQPPPPPQLQPQYPSQTQATVAPSVMVPETLRVQRLQVSDLDVDRLTVSELMAQKILVSEVDAMSLKLNELSSQSGSITTDEIKLPENFIENIINSIQSATQQSESAQVSQPPVTEKRITYYKEESTNTDDSLIPPQEATSQPAKTEESASSSTTTQQKPQEILTPQQVLSQAVPYPHIYVLPPSFYPERPSTSTAQPSTVDRSMVDSSTNTTVASDPEVPSVLDEIPDPSIPNLSAQLLKACHSSISRTIRRVLVELSSHLNTGDEKRDAQTAIIVLIVLLAALILLGFTSRSDTVHHHHWEYFNPPSGDRPA